MTNPEYWERHWSGSATGGKIWCPGLTGNQFWVLYGTLPANPSADWRAEYINPGPPQAPDLRIVNGPLYIYYSPSSIAVIFSDTVPANHSVSATHEALAAAGFPSQGEPVQMRGVWDAGTEVLDGLWRRAGRDLDDDADWNVFGTAAFPGVDLQHIFTNWTFGSRISTTSSPVSIRRVLRRVNGSKDIDINLPVDLDGVAPSATSFVCSTGQTVTIDRSGGLTTEVLRPQVMWTPHDTYTGPVDVPNGAETIRSAMR